MFDWESFRPLHGGTDRAKRPARRSLAAFAIACAALLTGLLASPAAAFHIPGAAYSGPVSGGGSISFMVSGDGASVTNLALQGPIDGDTCTLNFASYTRPVAINSNAFSNGEVSGSFSSVQHAQGTLNITESFGGGFFCHISQTWSAATSASPAGSAECQSANAEVKRLKGQLSKAKKTGNEAKVKKLQKKLKRAKNNRSLVCG